MPEIRTTSSTGGQKGTKLARFDLIPAGPLTELAEHYGRGARKYANHQWRQGYEWSKSIAALGRHYALFMQGFDYDVCSNDPEGCSFVDAKGEPYEPTEPDTCFNHTGSHHMAAVAWHAFLLLEFKDSHPDHDDRYRPEPAPVEDLVMVDIDPDTGTSSGLPSGTGDMTEGPEVGRRWQAGVLDESFIISQGQLLDAFSPLSTGTHDSDCVLDFNFSEPITWELEMDEPSMLETIQALYGVFARAARFEMGDHGLRDLEVPLPVEVEDAIDNGWEYMGRHYGFHIVVDPDALNPFGTLPIHESLTKSWIRDYDAPSYLSEYRRAFGVDGVGGVL